MVVIVDADGLSSYTLAQYINEIGLIADVYSYKVVTSELVNELKPSHIILSFGDYQVSAFEKTAMLIHTYMPTIPMLGIGMGFYAILNALHPQLTYLKSATRLDNRAIPPQLERRSVYHQGVGIFAHVPSPFQTLLWPVATVKDAQLPHMVDMTAWTQDDKGELDVVVGMRHQDWPLEAVLCDPCSVLTQHGLALIKHFLK